jgi:uncharacterized protein YbjT (DUF2867 family)
MKRVIMTGATGMTGGLVLKKCLERDDVAMVTSITRRPSGITHEKLEEVIHSDYLDYSSITDKFNMQDICFYCIGVYTGQVPGEEFRKITVDYTRAFTGELGKRSPGALFCFLSGMGADRTEKSRVMFSRDKGAAENIILQTGFSRVALFRPGYIYPVTPRKEPNLIYSIYRKLWPLIKRLFPDSGISSEELAHVMVKVGFDDSFLSGPPELENKEIRRIAQSKINLR